MNKTLPDVFKQMRESLSEVDARDMAAELLKTTPEALKAFEEAYAIALLDFDNQSVRDMSGVPDSVPTCSEELIDRIVTELLDDTEYIDFDGYCLKYGSFKHLGVQDFLTADDIMKIDESVRPQLAGRLAKKDIESNAVRDLLPLWHMHLTHEDPKAREMAYHVFRQGMDLMDIDPVLYSMLGMNPTAMSKWFPNIVMAVFGADSFIKVPKTRIVRVPMPVLQMSRIQYETLNASTLKIIDKWAYKAFNLRDDGDYFIKTGTYSSKFDFRNARVVSAKEVRELGEYLTYIQFLATCNAGYITHNGFIKGAIIYGTSTTNEYVVREFIPDKENNPTIYQGMPLHTEYRFFVDFDTNEVLGVAPYWEPELLKDRFRNKADKDHPHMKHDYVIYKMHEEVLMKRFYENKARLAFEMERILPFCTGLKGQYSIDIMQNGDDFWLIDMATADHSALNEYMPQNALKKAEENWLAIDIK